MGAISVNIILSAKGGISGVIINSLCVSSVGEEHLLIAEEQHLSVAEEEQFPSVKEQCSLAAGEEYSLVAGEECFVL